MEEWKWIFFGFLKGLGAFFLIGFIAGCAFMYLVRNDPDGQAGMGAAFGGLYAGVIAGIVTFVVSLRRDHRKARGRHK